MFYYSPPKANGYGLALRPRDPSKAWPKMESFLKFYFEPPESPEAELEVNSYAMDAKNRANVLLGGQSASRWKLKSQRELEEAIKLVMEGYPWPQPEEDPTDPILLSLSFYLNWKSSLFPKPEWLDVYATDARLRSMNMQIYLGNRSFTAMGFTFPLASQEPASYDFLQRFSERAPFKMNPKHFRLIELSSHGKLTQRKPDQAATIALQKAII